MGTSKTEERLYIRYTSYVGGGINISTNDLIGVRFNNLVVASKTQPPNKNAKKKYIYWDCICDCGSHRIVSTTDLRSGKVQKCKKCAEMDRIKKRRSSAVGDRFGMLTVQEMIYEERETKTVPFCNCTCDCGETVVRSLNYLRTSRLTGSTCSCGCMTKKKQQSEMIKTVGKKYGRLTVLEEFKSENGMRVICECDCGNIVEKSRRDVLYGHTKSCGCLQSESASKSNTKDFSGVVSEYGIELIRQDHKNSNGVWEWKCKCFCGNTFVSVPIKILNGHITSCGCRKRSSRESLIEKYLIANGVEFKTQFTFEDCKDKYPLRFDFAIMKNGVLSSLIEYDEEQHFKSVAMFGGDHSLAENIRRDKIKDEYCKKNSIPLYRLKYDLSDNEIKEKIANIIYP